MGSTFNIFTLRSATRQGENVTGHTVGQGTTFELKIYHFCGVMLLTVDNLLCLVRVIYPNLETYDTVGVVASKY